MQKYQFFRIETFSHDNARGIVSEILRVPSYCKHVEQPLSTYPVFSGVFDLNEAPRLLRYLIEYSNAKTLHKTPHNRHVFAAGITSYPLTLDLIESDPAELALYLKWERLTLNFLKMEFKDNLFNVSSHLDERFPHLHFFVMPRLMPDGKINLNAHPGRNSNLKNQNETGKVKMCRFRAEMSALLRRFYHSVGIYLGMTLKGQITRKRALKRIWLKKIKPESDKKIEEMVKLKSVPTVCPENKPVITEWNNPFLYKCNVTKPLKSL